MAALGDEALGSIEGRMKNLLSKIERFNTEFHKSLAHTETNMRMENFVCSGVNVHLLLSMITVGAAGRTRQQILDALHITPDDFPNFKNVQTIHLQEVPDIMDKAVELISHYVICIDKYRKVSRFRQKLPEFFNPVELLKLPFVDNNKKATIKLNQWFFEKSNKKIHNFMARADLPFNTQIVLACVISFKARWLRPFERVSDEPFFVDRDTRINVPTMHITGSFLYKDLDALNAECVVIPYQLNFIFIKQSSCIFLYSIRTAHLMLSKVFVDRPFKIFQFLTLFKCKQMTDYKMVIVRPKEIEGLKIVEENLDKLPRQLQLDLGDESMDGVCNLETRDLRLSLPKFKFNSYIDFEPYLRRLGMMKLFERTAELRGIILNPALEYPTCVGKFLQKAFIEVDEIETQPTSAETSAATSPVSTPASAPSSTPREFKVDRPFFFRVVKKSCNLTLLSGRVVVPKSV